MNNNKRNGTFLKCLLVSIILMIFVCLMHTSVTLSQWTPYSNTGWLSQPLINTSYFSFSPISNYQGISTNGFYPSYMNSYSSGLFSFPGSIYGNSYRGLYPGLISYNYTSGLGYNPFSPFSTSSFLNPYTGPYSWQAPTQSLLLTPFTNPFVPVSVNNQWTQYIQSPWIQYTPQPPIAKSGLTIINIDTEGLLESRIREALGLEPNETITKEKILTLTSLEAKDMCLEKMITIGPGERPTHEIVCKPHIDISLLAELTYLTELNLNMNTIEDIGPLAALTNLKKLILCNTNTSDLEALAGLTNLTYLDIHGAEVSDISPLAGLTNLETLRLHSNEISDISPLAGLTNLIVLILDNNKISDISPLIELINLEELLLGNNKISNINPLTWLTDLKKLELHDNNLDSGDCPDINVLISRGVSVQSDLNCQ